MKWNGPEWLCPTVDQARILVASEQRAIRFLDPAHFGADTGTSLSVDGGAVACSGHSSPGGKQVPAAVQVRSASRARTCPTGMSNVFPSSSNRARLLQAALISTSGTILLGKIPVSAIRARRQDRPGVDLRVGGRIDQGRSRTSAPRYRSEGFCHDALAPPVQAAGAVRGGLHGCGQVLAGDGAGLVHHGMGCLTEMVAHLSAVQGLPPLPLPVAQVVLPDSVGLRWRPSAA